jgi:hypothetical protein
MAGSNRVGRLSMNGFFGGSVVGFPVAFCSGHFSPLVWGSIAVVSTFLGYQYSQVPVSSDAEPWKLNGA